MGWQGLIGFGGGATGLSLGGIASPTWDASGGNVVAEPGNGFKYHIFTSPGNFVVSTDGADGELEGLVIGGGGGGSRQHGGGGGAGGLVHFKLPSGQSCAGTNAVVIGSAGAADPWPGSESSGSHGNPGQASTLTFPATPYDYVANGGGRGGKDPSNAAQNGGSGGGQMGWTPGPATQGAGAGEGPPTSGDGPETAAGGQAYQNPGGRTAGGGAGGGGGGGAGGAGGGQSTSTEGIGQPGGAGQPFPAFAGPLFPTMPPAWQGAVGPAGVYAGGGGGGAHSGPPGAPNAGGLGGTKKTEGGEWYDPPDIGSGGGGAGGVYNSSEPNSGDGNPGLDGTGGGGGGGGANDVGASGGGNGLVIIRYPV